MAVALFMKVRARAGRRDDLRAAWEAHLKPRAAENPAQTGYAYCYDRADPDVIWIFEHYSDEAELQKNAQAPFFAAFMEATADLVDGPPEVAMADPVWLKGMV